MSRGKIVIGAAVVALAMLVVAVPANAAQPKAGFWYSSAVDPDDEDNLSSIQFRVAKNRKKLAKVTIYWRCGNQSGYYTFRDPPIPIAIRKGRFKLVGAADPPTGTSTRDFTLKGRFISRQKARYTMKLERCGPRASGELSYAQT